MVRDAARDETPGGKQIVFFFMAATVVAVVVFLCGVLVGRGVPRRGMVSPGPIGERFAIPDLQPMTLVTASSRPSAGASASDDLTYPQRLTGRTGTVEVITASDRVSGDAEHDGREPTATEVSGRDPVSSPSEVDGFAVQVSANRGASAAQAIADELRSGGYPAYVLDPFPEDPVPFHRVRVGPFRTRAEAEDVRDRLQGEARMAAAYVIR